MNATTAAIENSIDGRELPQDQPVRCIGCHDTLREGLPVTVAALRHPSESVWRLGDVWCAACAPTPRSHEDDADAAETVLAEGRIGFMSDVARQRHYPVAVDVTLLSTRQRRTVDA